MASHIPARTLAEEISPVTLPDSFYLPRRSAAAGLEIRDVMPLDRAITYVTDGVRVGIQLRTGEIRWFLEPRGGIPTAESYVLRREALPEQLDIHEGPGETITAIWRRNPHVFR